MLLSTTPTLTPKEPLDVLTGQLPMHHKGKNLGSNLIGSINQDHLYTTPAAK